MNIKLWNIGLWNPKMMEVWWKDDFPFSIEWFLASMLIFRGVPYPFTIGHTNGGFSIAELDYRSFWVRKHTGNLMPP